MLPLILHLTLDAEQRAREEEEAAKKREEEERLAAARRERELERQAAAEEAKRKAQREAEAEEHRVQRNLQPSTDGWRRAATSLTSPARAMPPRAESPAPSPASATATGKYRPGMFSSQRPESPAPTSPAPSAPAPKYRPPGAVGGAVGGGVSWRQREAEKAAQRQTASPAVSNAPLPGSKDDEGFENPTKAWRPKRLQGQS